MKRMIKVLSLILVGVSIFSLIPSQPIKAAETIKEFEVKVRTIDDTFPDKISVYSYKGKLMISLDDVAQISRCEYTSSNGKHVLKHARGMRSITIDEKNQTLSENKDTYKTNVLNHKNNILVPAYPMLTYLDATCRFDTANKTLIATMPVHTFWEAFAFTLDGKMNVYSDESKKAKIIMDLIVDMTPGSGGQSFLEVLLKGADQSSAVLASMKTDIYKYPSVITQSQEWLSIFNTTAAKYPGVISKGTDALTMIDAKVLFDDLKLYSGDNKIAELDTVERWRKYIKENHKKLKLDPNKVGDLLGIYTTILDTFVTADSVMVYDEKLLRALANIVSEKTIQLAGNPIMDPNYIKPARDTSNNLKSIDAMVLSKAYENAFNLIAEKSVEKILEWLSNASASSFVMSLGVAGVVINAVASSEIGKYTPFSQIAVSEADLMAIMSAEYYNQAWLIMNGLGKKAATENFHNQVTMQALYDSYLMLLRFSLNFHESKIKYLESSGDIISELLKIEQTAKLAKVKEINNRADAIAKTIDMMNLCDPTALKKFTDLEKAASTFNEKSLAKLNETTNQNESQKYWDDKYASVLKEYRDFARELGKQNFDYIDKINQPWKNMSENSDTKEYGYAYRDIDGNGIQELIILSKDMMIYGIYTHTNGQPILLGNYWSRYTAELDGSNYIYTNGGTGIYQNYQKYKIAPNAKELELVLEIGHEDIYSDNTYNYMTEYYYIDNKSREKVIVTKDWFERAFADSFKLKGNDGLKFIPIKKPVETKEESGGDMYSSYAFLSSFNPSTGIAKFDFIKVVENDEEGLYEYINNNKKLREVNLKGIDIIIDGSTNYYITGNETTSDFKTDLKGFRKLYSLDRKENPDWGWLYNCLYYITVDKNGKPVKIKTTWRS